MREDDKNKQYETNTISSNLRPKLGCKSLFAGPPFNKSLNKITYTVKTYSANKKHQKIQKNTPTTESTLFTICFISFVLIKP